MILLVIAQLIIWNGPRLTPAEAARILREGPGLANFSNRPAPLPNGPRVIVVGSSPTSGPFGPLRSTPIAHYEPAAWINGLPVSRRGLEEFAVLSGALNSVQPRRTK